MDTFEELNILKAKADRLNAQVNKVFIFLSNRCNFKGECVYHYDGENFYNCSHRQHALYRTGHLTVCTKKRCPKIK